MIDKSIYETFEKIEKDYKSRAMDWGNYSSEIDWDIKDGILHSFVKDTRRDVICNNLGRAMRHELRDNAIVSVLEKINIKTILDIGADTGLFLARCKCNGIEGVGIEPNKEVVEYVNKKNFVKLYCFDLEKLMQSFENNKRIEVCSMLNTFHGEWKDSKLKDDFTKYLSKSFRYVVLSDDYKNGKPDPIIEKYFNLVYDFNMYGLESLREHKPTPKLLRKIAKSFKKVLKLKENQIYKKMHILCVHKLYISKVEN